MLRYTLIKAVYLYNYKEHSRFRVVSDRPTFIGDLAFDILAAGKNLQIIRDSREKKHRIKYIAIVDTIKIKSSDR